MAVPLPKKKEHFDSTSTTSQADWRKLEGDYAKVSEWIKLNRAYAKKQWKVLGMIICLTLLLISLLIYLNFGDKYKFNMEYSLRKWQSSISQLFKPNPSSSHPSIHPQIIINQDAPIYFGGADDMGSGAIRFHINETNVHAKHEFIERP